MPARPAAPPLRRPSCLIRILVSRCSGRRAADSASGLSSLA
ncbi:hypothetical protein L837_2023 [Mycobacterium avium MAV_061107_1842]|nr:hypothetical protein L837_2023 [Mycobacterium avium MAV_061107_1842]